MINTTKWYDPWEEMTRLKEAMDNSIANYSAPLDQVATPLINVFTGEDDVIVVSEIPGVDSKDVDLSVRGDLLTIKGDRQRYKVEEGETWHRRECKAGSFSRSIKMPFKVDESRVEASYDKGVLQVKLPRANEYKPIKIKIANKD